LVNNSAEASPGGVTLNNEATVEVRHLKHRALTKGMLERLESVLYLGAPPKPILAE
jgi:hypothetical protein